MADTCGTCRWAATVDDREGLVCIRFPPTYVGPRSWRSDDIWTGFPMIRRDWTCGEHNPFPTDPPPPESKS